jgi:RNA recognition motif-containing protein
MEPSKTLWMGNLEPGTDQNFIREIFNQLSKIY